MNPPLRPILITTAALLLLTFRVPGAAAQTDWEQRAESRAQELIAKNGAGTDQALAKDLLAMYAKDQEIRARMRDAGATRQHQFDAELTAIDNETTPKLKRIVTKHGWPTIALVGAQASQSATVMLVHSADHVWQEKLLPRLTQLVDEDKIFGSDVAGLTDRILVSKNKPQKFGTQFKTVDGEISIWLIEDEKHVDERRARYLLPPMDVYRKTLSDMYHMPIK